MIGGVADLRLGLVLQVGSLGPEERHGASSLLEETVKERKPCEVEH